MTSNTKILNLKSIPCPLNVVKCKLALEKLKKEDMLLVELDRGEPEVMVKETLENSGYKLETVQEEKDWIKLAIYYELT